MLNLLLPRPLRFMTACVTPGLYSSAEGKRGSLNCAEKLTYRHSFPLLVVYYRQSEASDLVKNCADNETLPITRRNHVAGDCQLAGNLESASGSLCQNRRPLHARCPTLSHLVAARASWPHSQRGHHNRCESL